MSLTIRSTMNNQTAAQGIDNTDKNTDNSKQPRNRKTMLKGLEPESRL